MREKGLIVSMHASKIYVSYQSMLQFANSLMFTTYAIYYIKELGFNPFQLLLIGMFLEVTCLVFETVTGVFADTKGRRLSIIAGLLIIGTAYVLEGSVPALRGIIPFIGAVIAAEMIRGVGETFVSGASQAWLTDEIGEKNIGEVFLKAGQYAQAANILGVLCSVVLSSLGLNLPYLMGGILYLLTALFLVFFMKETHFIPEVQNEKGWLVSALHTFKDGLGIIKASAVLGMLAFVCLFTGAASEGWDRLWEAQFLITLKMPEILHFNASMWFGCINLLSALFCFVAAALARRYIRTENEHAVIRIFLVLSGIRIIGIIGFALSPDFTTALGLLILISMTGTISAPLFHTWVNQLIPSERRATVLSMISQLDALGQTAGGPAVGLIGSRFSLRTSLVWVGILQIPVILVYLSGRKKA
ncbi:MFS transporter [Peribacillus kribbensis]|uniref:MFS transporter n=1 Tax=Peribacillus kribbensis TaxID=356658 RepID=UPI00041A651B|nr:MFS transporter [Peribacillus kribbensis]